MRPAAFAAIAGDTIVMADVVLERFQGIKTRGLARRENRILAGKQSSLDVVGGRMSGQATAAANLATNGNTVRRSAAFAKARCDGYLGAGTPAPTRSGPARCCSAPTAAPARAV